MRTAYWVNLFKKKIEFSVIKLYVIEHLLITYIRLNLIDIIHKYQIIYVVAKRSGNSGISKSGVFFICSYNNYTSTPLNNQ